MTAAEYTWRDSELRSPPLRAFNAVGIRAAPGWGSTGRG